jgi:hypothetical protein
MWPEGLGNLIKIIHLFGTKDLYPIHGSHPHLHIQMCILLTSCTPTESNLYLDSSLETVIREPTLYKLLMFHIPHLMSIFRHLGHLSKESIQVRGSLWFLITSLFLTVRSCQPHAQPPSWRNIPCCWLSAVAYSIYSQLPSIAGGRPSICKPRTRHAVVTRGPT